jgi:hypothetical protein
MESRWCYWWQVLSGSKPWWKLGSVSGDDVHQVGFKAWEDKG